MLPLASRRQSRQVDEYGEHVDDADHPQHVGDRADALAEPRPTRSRVRLHVPATGNDSPGEAPVALGRPHTRRVTRTSARSEVSAANVVE